MEQQTIRATHRSPRLHAELEPRAREQVKVGLLLEAVAQQEHIDVTDADVDARIAAMAEEAGAAGERVRALYQDADARRHLRTGMLQSRASDVRVAHARGRTVQRVSSVADPSENG